MVRPSGDIWVFGYGSLMWRPNFAHADTEPALVHGYHRALCIYSTTYRGTHAKPGLVLGLDRGGSCRGMAFRVAAADIEAVMDYLYAREMINEVYRPTWLNARLPDRTVKAYGFVANPGHPQYVGDLEDAEAVRLILQGCGKSGHCVDYVRNTIEHLKELGIRDHTLERLLRKTKAELASRG